MASSKDFSPFVPFDLYDFFGYLFPGILFVSNAFIFLSEVDNEFFNEYLKTIFINNPSESFSFVGSLFLVVAAIVILYTLGHFIATISHIIIDRVLIDGVEGYPVNYLLDLKREKRNYSEATFKYLFTFFNFLFLIPLLPIKYITMKHCVYFILSLIALLIFLRIIIMLVRIYSDDKTVETFGKKWYFKIYYLPSEYLIDNLIGFFRRLLGMDRKFPNSFIIKYKELFSTRFANLNSDEVDSENYWLPLFYVNNASPTNHRILYTWLHLYGFSRNACSAFYISGILIIVYLLFNESAYTLISKCHIFILWCLAVILGLRYWILYSHYYSKAVIRAFFELTTNKNNV